MHLVVTLLTTDGAVTLVPAAQHRQRPSARPGVRRAARRGARRARDAQRAERPGRCGSSGDAHGPVTFGYVAETPIWRASYRLIVDSRADTSTSTATLQGWALLHNDTDENWHDVHLELAVNGEPDSFVYPMAAPRYARRALVHPDEPLSTQPQLQDTSADALWGDHVAERPSEKEEANALDRTKQRIALLAESALAGGVAVTEQKAVEDRADPHDGPQVRPAGKARVFTWHGAGGALFVYAIPGGLSLEARASAIVPFVQRAVSVESAAFFDGPGSSARAAIRFVNTTGQTLPTGTIAVFGGGRLHRRDVSRPAQARRAEDSLQIGNDLDAEVAAQELADGARSRSA